MEERSLKITGADTGFFNKLTKTLTRMLIPTKIGINGMVITIKRNAMLKTYEAFSKESQEYNNDELEKKFDSAYTVYLEALDKHIMDSIYKKVRNGTASDFEKEALSKYYEVTSLKEKDYIDNKGLDNAYYKDYILTYIEKFGKATREEINNLIYPKLPTNMSEKNKNNRVRYIISQLKQENKIENEGSLTKSSWIIKK